jgi:hypothetical protein
VSKQELLIKLFLASYKKTGSDLEAAVGKMVKNTC